jgi:hypothetical protein
MAAATRKNGSGTRLFMLSDVSRGQPPNSPYQYHLKRKLESVGGPLCQIMAEHILEERNFNGEPLPHGFSIMTRRHSGASALDSKFYNAFSV